MIRLRARIRLKRMLVFREFDYIIILSSLPPFRRAIYIHREHNNLDKLS